MVILLYNLYSSVWMQHVGDPHLNHLKPTYNELSYNEVPVYSKLFKGYSLFQYVTANRQREGCQLDIPYLPQELGQTGLHTKIKHCMYLHTR